MKITKKRIIVFLVFLAILAASFFYGGNYNKEETKKESQTVSEVQKDDKSEKAEIQKEQKNEEAEKKDSENKKISKKENKDEKIKKDSENREKTEKDNKDKKEKSENKEITEKDSKDKKEEKIKKESKNKSDLKEKEVKNQKAEKQNKTLKTEELKCHLYVQCRSILDNMDLLDKSKKDIIPKDGVIFKNQEVSFKQGESVFDVLKREMKNNKIHMEFSITPVYNSNYIEGIANIYEFDCGELSGWMYSVNGEFPNYGSSRYILKDGDCVEFAYTCDLGHDIGNDYSGKDEKDGEK